MLGRDRVPWCVVVTYAFHSGEWLAGKRHGYGKYFDMTSGDVLSGTWINDQLNGEGKFVGSSGPIHGDGHGKLVPASVGNVYTGGFKDNKKHGYGKMAYSTAFRHNRGESYEGEWVEDLQHGMRWCHCEHHKLICINIFYIMFCSGHGVYTYANGNVYDGEWINGERCGPGVLTFKNGDVFAGNFFQNAMNGKGTFTPNGGDPVESEWIGGERVIEEIQRESSEEVDDVEVFDFSNFD